MIGIIAMAVILVVGPLLLWRFLDLDLPVAAVFVFMVLIGINVAGYYWLGWWGGA